MKYKINKKLAFRKIDGVYYVIDPENMKLFSFNETATFIWDTILSRKDLSEILKSLVDEYEIDKEVAKNDLEEFICLLKNNNLITEEC